MKKIVLLAAPLLLSCVFAGCKKNVNYLNYVSEKRTDIYLYSDDGLEIKIYLSEKETPFCADGVKGNVGDLTEIFVTLPENADGVDISCGAIAGEMSFRAVDNCYYLSGSGGGIYGESAQVTLTYGGKSKSFAAMSVKYGNVLDCDGAAECVIEHERGLFDSMTENGIFKGEIFVRLLYDEGCYYYVGVCGRDKKIEAFLVDGERGKIIARKQLNG